MASSSSFVVPKPRRGDAVRIVLGTDQVTLKQMVQDAEAGASIREIKRLFVETFAPAARDAMKKHPQRVCSGCDRDWPQTQHLCRLSSPGELFRRTSQRLWGVIDGDQLRDEWFDRIESIATVRKRDIFTYFKRHYTNPRDEFFKEENQEAMAAWIDRKTEDDADMQQDDDF